MILGRRVNYVILPINILCFVCISYLLLHAANEALESYKFHWNNTSLWESTPSRYHMKKTLIMKLVATIMTFTASCLLARLAVSCNWCSLSYCVCPKHNVEETFCLYTWEVELLWCRWVYLLNVTSLSYFIDPNSVLAIISKRWSKMNNSLHYYGAVHSFHGNPPWVSFPSTSSLDVE